MFRKFLKLAGLVFVGLFVAGAQSGWQRAYSTNALVLSAMPNARVLPVSLGRYVIVLTCPDDPGKPVYRQLLADDDAFILHPNSDQIEALKQTAKRLASTGGNLLSNDFVKAGITGGTASQLIDARVGSMRRTLMASRFARVTKQRNAIIAGLIVSAGSGYFLGDWAFGNWPPRCGSDAGLKVFEDVVKDKANRQLLRKLIFRNDSELTTKIGALLSRFNDPPSASDQMVVATPSLATARSPAQIRAELINKAIEVEAERVNQVNRELLNGLDFELMLLSADPRDSGFDGLRNRCDSLAKRTNRRVCTYLQPRLPESRLSEKDTR